MKSRAFQDLKHLSAFVGKDSMLTQGAGGNTSLKENGVLWVKASGKWLSRALDEPIFVSLDLQSVIHALNDSQSDLNTLPNQENSSLRPSIETTVHAIMPQPVVLHIHSIRTLSYAVRKDGRSELAQKLEGIEWDWIPYYRPGQPLAKAIQAKLPHIPNVLILQNHGLIIAGESSREVEDLLKEVERRLDISSHPVPAFPEQEINSLAKQLGLQLPKDTIIHSLGTDPQALAFIQQGVLYPDQAVFLGAQSPVFSAEELSISKSSFPHYVIIPNIGVLLKPTITPGMEAMLVCHALLLQRLKRDAHLQTLPMDEVRSLMQWEAEKFRQHLDK